jgi:hypothetical protein
MGLLGAAKNILRSRRVKVKACGFVRWALGSLDLSCDWECGIPDSLGLPKPDPKFGCDKAVDSSTLLVPTPDVYC